MFGRFLKSKTFWGGIAAIVGGVLHLTAEAKAKGIGTVAVGVISGQYTETLTAIGAGLGLIGVKHALLKAAPNVGGGK